MQTSLLWGVALVVFAGVLAGTLAAPIKVMRKFRYEHWAFVSMLCGLLLAPWLTLTLLFPDAFGAIAQLSPWTLAKANLCSMAWGVANVLCSLCLLRIGFSLSVGLLTGVGLPLGVLVPMLLKGSGKFADAPSILSGAGLIIVAATVVMVAGVVLVALAGFGRERGAVDKNKGFKAGLMMAVAAGALQVGLSFAFVYSQGPLVAAFQARGASDLAANIGVWASVLPGGAAVNLLWPGFLMTSKRSWGTLLEAPVELALSVLMGLLFFLMVIALGHGMKELGALGASIGFGLYQGLQLLSSQSVGVASGEWRGAPNKAVLQMGSALALLLAAVCLMSIGRWIA